ncbi:preprotein translocase subunit SecY [Thermincola potens]|uniref:Protein translocase subunit SecY n=1 Tax=Thermincola potens (strain JR) TaxID=635013 RepID=D5XAA3_THEPJ|nr:preprotein translocase subunit SecY [Thermincola potens]ADG81202.1 preprotein translocase, SecY subunit [Thermincola potens JR]
MFEALKSSLKLGDLRKKILFTLAMFVVFRIGAHIPVPGINHTAIEQLIKGGGSLLGFFDVISGGAFKRFSIFAMSITPYINASIIMQLLTVVIPKLEQLSKEGEEGRKKITQYIRYGTVVLGFIQSLGMAFTLRAAGALENPSFGSYMIIAITLTAGTAFLMWLGEQITEKGIGNGISLIIFAGIVAGIPGGLYNIYEAVRVGTVNPLSVVLLVIVAALVIAAVVAVNEGQRRIPVQYAKRVVGRRVYGGQSTHIPLKVNQAGVIPIIFASSILMFPTTIANFFPNNAFSKWINSVFAWGSVSHSIMYALLIIFFTYFYTAITFNPMDVADNMKKYGGFIPGLRPGRPTAEYLDKILTRITLSGAVFLALIAILPAIILGATKIPNIYFGGTSLLIVVGVALETMKQIESHLLMRHYQGFMK